MINANLIIFYCFLKVIGFAVSQEEVSRNNFSAKLLPDLKGAKIRTVFMPDPAFLQIKKQNCRNIDGRNMNQVCWQGLVPDIYQSLAKTLNFTFSLYKPKDRKFGNYNKTSGKWNGMIKDIQEDRADVIVAGLVASLERSEAVDLSFPFFVASHVFIVGKGVSQFSFTMFFKPLTTNSWIFIYLVVLLASIVMFISVKFGKERKIYEFSLLKSLIYSFGAYGAFSVRRWSVTPLNTSGR